MATPNVGPTSACFFVGRAELVTWINALLGLSLSKVEEARAACRVPRRAPRPRRAARRGGRCASAKP